MASTQTLLKANASLDLQNNFGNTALICAVIGKQEATLRTLLDAKADPTIDAGTALRGAAKIGFDAGVRALLEAKVDVNAGPRESSAVALALKNQQFSTVALLMDHGALLEAADVLALEEAQSPSTSWSKWFSSHSKNDNNDYVNFCRGVDRQRHGEMEKAEEYFKQAANYAPSQRRLGDLAVETGHHLEALKLYESAVKMGDVKAKAKLAELTQNLTNEVAAAVSKYAPATAALGVFKPTTNAEPARDSVDTQAVKLQRT